MENLHWFDILGGFGILLFSLRYLNSILGNIVSRRFKPILNRTLATPTSCFSLGFIVTLIVQASSITVIGSMGLLSNSLINVEQAFFMALGASVGTTIKSWFFHASIYDYSLLFIGVSSVALALAKKLFIREVFQLIMALGFAFLGFKIMSQISYPLSHNTDFLSFLEHYNADSLKSQFIAIIIGFSIATVVQSSSTVVLLITSLGITDQMSFAAGCALILGANIGTTTTAILVSIEHGNNVRKLATGYFITKTIGVLITLFFFPYFLNSVTSFCEFVLYSNNSSTKLLAAHTLFNVINAIWWSFFYPFVFKSLDKVFQDEAGQNQILPNVIRRIISSNYKLAIDEIKEQLVKLESITKNLTDYCLELLLVTNVDKAKKSNFPIRKDFENLKYTVYEIILQLNKSHPGLVDTYYTEKNLRFISECNEFYSKSLSFCILLERGIFIDYYTFPKEIQKQFEDFETAFNELWLSVILNKSTEEKVNKIKDLLKAIDETYLDIISSKNTYSSDHLAWIYESISYLNILTNHLVVLRKVSLTFN